MKTLAFAEKKLSAKLQTRDTGEIWADSTTKNDLKYLKTYSADLPNEPKYSVAHIITYPYLFAGNQGNHQNFVPSLGSLKLWLIWIGMKQKKIFLTKTI